MVFKVNTLTVHGQDYIGCKNSSTKVMLSAQAEGSSTIHDLLFTAETAILLKQRLEVVLQENKNTLVTTERDYTCPSCGTECAVSYVGRVEEDKIVDTIHKCKSCGYQATEMELIRYSLSGG